MELEFYRQIYEKSSNIKFHQNLSSGSPVVPCGQAGVTKLIVAFRNFSNATRNVQFAHFVYISVRFLTQKVALVQGFLRVVKFHLSVLFNSFSAFSY